MVYIDNEYIDRILGEHGIETKYTDQGDLLALDVSCLDGDVLQVWVDAPQSIRKLYQWLGY